MNKKTKVEQSRLRGVSEKKMFQIAFDEIAVKLYDSIYTKLISFEIVT